MRQAAGTGGSAPAFVHAMINVIAKNLPPAVEARLLDRAMRVLPTSGDIYVMLRHYSDGDHRCPVSEECTAGLIGCHDAEARLALDILRQFKLIHTSGAQS